MDVDARARSCAEMIHMEFRGRATQAEKERWAAQAIAALVREAVAEEREACAQICEHRSKKKTYDLRDDAAVRYNQDKTTAIKLTEAIRARKP